MSSRGGLSYHQTPAALEVVLLTRPQQKTRPPAPSHHALLRVPGTSPCLRCKLLEAGACLPPSEPQVHTGQDAGGAGEEPSPSPHAGGARRQDAEMPGEGTARHPPEQGHAQEGSPPLGLYLKEEAQHQGQRPKAEAGAYLLGVDTLVGVQALLLLHLLQL